MFVVGANYRIFLAKEGSTSREGTLSSFSESLLSLEIEGVLTIFPLTTISYVEAIDREAELTRNQARKDAWPAALAE